MNHVVLIGRLTKDAEIRRTASGTAVASFTLAVDNYRKDDGADFPRCVAWGKTAELIERNVKKGHRIAIVGRITTRTYESKGQKHFVTEITVEELEFLEKKEKPIENESAEFIPVDTDDYNLPF